MFEESGEVLCGHDSHYVDEDLDQLDHELQWPPRKGGLNAGSISEHDLDYLRVSLSESVPF